MRRRAASVDSIDADTLDRDPRHIYDILDENLELVREVSIQDVRTAFERW